MPSVPSDDPSISHNRRQGPNARDNAARAYRAIVARCGLPPEQHVDALLDALLAAHPHASVIDAAAWFDPSILQRELGRADAEPNDGGITKRKEK